MYAFPDFDKDVRRPFAVDEQCYDCTEFYAGCNARSANPPMRCRDFLRLPDVLPGTYGQVFPPSRMGGQKEPRLLRGPAEKEIRPKAKPAQAPSPTRKPSKATSPKRTPSPAANHGLYGERLCGCGALLPKRRRCCDDCRRKRREETMSRRRSRKRLPVAIDADSGVPVARAENPLIGAGSGAHNYSGPRYPLPTSGPVLCQ